MAGASRTSGRKRKQPLSEATIVDEDHNGSAPADASQTTPAPPAEPSPTAAADTLFIQDTPANDLQEISYRDDEEDGPMETDHMTSEQVVQEIRQRKKRRRLSTPEEDNNYEIDTTTTTLGTLAQNRRKGKKSKLEQRMQQIDWKAVAKRRKEEEAEMIEMALKPSQQRQKTLELPETTSQQDGQEPEMEHTGPRLHLVNGQMVVLEDSLNLDRGPNHGPGGELRNIEDGDVTRRLTSHSFINAARRDPVERIRRSNKADPWTVDETDAFYEALRVFGTDFDIISKMFPGKTRNHVKRKFVREEKHDEERIRRALISEMVPMDMETFLLASNRKLEDYKDPDLIEAELQQAREEQKNELEREQQERDEKAKRKQEKAQEKTRAQQEPKTRKKRERKKKDAPDDAGEGTDQAKKQRKPRAKKTDSAPAQEQEPVPEDRGTNEDAPAGEEDPDLPAPDAEEGLNDELPEPEPYEEEPIDGYDDEMENEHEYLSDDGEEYD